MLQDSNGKVKIQGQPTAAFGIEIGLRQGDPLSTTVQYLLFMSGKYIIHYSIELTAFSAEYTLFNNCNFNPYSANVENMASF
jgi:hypothetical protein